MSIKSSERNELEMSQGGMETRQERGVLGLG